MNNAARNGHFEVVKWLHEALADRSLGALECAISGCHLEIAQFLLQHEYTLDAPQTIDGSEWCGDFDMIKWLHESSLLDSVTCTNTAAVCAARQDKLHIVQWLYTNYPDNLSNYARILDDPECDSMVRWAVEGHYTFGMDEAAAAGHLDVVRWFHENRLEGCTHLAMSRAARNGHLDVVKWLHSQKFGSVDAIGDAARNSHFHVVKCLYENENRPSRRSTTVMNNATTSGNLDLVKWLHENRGDGCTASAMDNAAAAGNLDLVMWLHKNREEGCTVHAMNKAAANGHLDVVKWLHENRQEGCTTLAMDSAAANGHLNVVKWLYEHRTEGCTTDAMDKAASGGHIDVVK